MNFTALPVLGHIAIRLFYEPGIILEWTKLCTKRYHTASSDKEAKKIYLVVCICMCRIVALFIIGSALFSFYSLHPEL